MSSPPGQDAVSHHTNGSRFQTAREVFVTVELYLSPKAAMGLRKVSCSFVARAPSRPLIVRQPHTSRKKTDKRESIKQTSSLVDDGQKKLRGKRRSRYIFTRLHLTK
jgi:hypothetical protein